MINIKLVEQLIMDNKYNSALALLDKFEGQADIYKLKGHILFGMRNLDAAICAYEQAILKVETVEVLKQLGLCHIMQAKFTNALKYLKKVIKIEPNCVVTLNNIGLCLDKLDQEEAIDYFNQATYLQPDMPEANINIANYYLTRGKYKAVICKLEPLITKHCSDPKMFLNLACAWEGLNQPEIALMLNLHALKLKPNCPKTKFTVGLNYLLLGLYTPGWDYLEARKELFSHSYSSNKPTWQGEIDPNKRLFIWQEEGIGDTLFMLSIIKDITMPITLQCDQRLHQLIENSFSNIECTTAIIAESKYDWQISIMSVARLLRRRKTDFTYRKYLYPAPHNNIRAKYKNMFGEQTALVGLAWRTFGVVDTNARSIALNNFTKLFNLTGLQFISIQYGDIHDEIQGLNIYKDEAIDNTIDISLSATQICALDLVISIDNACAYLAASCDVEVWNLLSKKHSPYWHASGTNTAWYPKMHLLRQQKLYEWQGVINQIHDMLLTRFR